MPDTPSMSERMKTRIGRLLYPARDPSDRDVLRTSVRIENLERNRPLHLAFVVGDREDLTIERRHDERLWFVLASFDDRDAHRDLELAVVRLDVDLHAETFEGARV